MHFFRAYLASAALVLVASTPAMGGGTSLASPDWNGSWAFRTSSSKQLHLLQADVIEKGEGDYYDNLGKTEYNIHQDQRQGNFGDVTVESGGQVDKVYHTGDDIGQNTNTIGAVNTSTNEIRIDGSGNVLDLANVADSNGCLNGAITVATIDGSSPSASTTSGCE